MEENNNEEKLATIKKYKLTKDKVEYFAKRLEDIRKEPMVMTEEAGEVKLTTEELLKKNQEFSILMLEMNLVMMANVVAVYEEASLEKEIQNVQMGERLQATLKNFGIDEKTFRRLFGAE